MATVKVKRGGGSSAKKGGTAAKSNGSGSKAGAKKAASAAQRSGAIDKIRKDIKKIAAALKKGETMKSQKVAYGVSDDGPIRRELAKAGFDSKGAKLTLEEFNAGNAAGRKRVVKERKDGKAWYILELETGLSEAELKKIVSDAGGPVNRVYTKTAKESSGKAGSRGR